MPDRRTLIVLGALVTGMTVTSGLLLILEPGPVAPLTGITLQSVQRGVSREARLFSTEQPSQQWKAIVIHDTGRPAGSARTLDRRHRQQGREGLGYHFVINNGHNSENRDDGTIEVGYRWQHQNAGHYFAPSPDADWFHNNAIGITLVGDADHQSGRASLTRAQLEELVWLVQTLQQRYDIPADQVYAQFGADSSDNAGSAGQTAFPRVWFQDQLLTRQVP